MTREVLFAWWQKRIEVKHSNKTRQEITELWKVFEPYWINSDIAALDSALTEWYNSNNWPPTNSELNQLYSRIKIEGNQGKGTGYLTRYSKSPDVMRVYGKEQSASYWVDSVKLHNQDQLRENAERKEYCKAHDLPFECSKKDITAHSKFKYIPKRMPAEPAKKEIPPTKEEVDESIKRMKELDDDLPF